MAAGSTAGSDGSAAKTAFVATPIAEQLDDAGDRAAAQKAQQSQASSVAALLASLLTDGPGAGATDLLERAESSFKTIVTSLTGPKTDTAAQATSHAGSSGAAASPSTGAAKAISPLHPVLRAYGGQAAAA